LVLAAGCGSGSSGSSPRSKGRVSAFGSPKAAALSWFAAVNQKNREAALAHFEPRAAAMADWSGGPSAWPTFSSVKCNSDGHSAGQVRVSCTFAESDAPAVGNPDSFWDVYLRRQPDGRWLIDNYGQG
jgi:hypothetical protein